MKKPFVCLALSCTTLALGVHAQQRMPDSPKNGAILRIEPAE
jgi:hypothetical protein